MVFEGADDETKRAELLATLDRFAEQIPADAPAVSALPKAVDLRRGLNIAACDMQPIVVLVVPDERRLEESEARLARTAWTNDVAGRCAYAVVTEAAQLESLSGLPDGLVKDGELTGSARMLVVEPDAFGVDGHVVASVRVGKSEELGQVILDGLEHVRFAPKESRDHVRAGRRGGVEWPRTGENTGER